MKKAEQVVFVIDDDPSIRTAIRDQRAGGDLLYLPFCLFRPRGNRLVVLAFQSTPKGLGERPKYPTWQWSVLE